jgi:trans-2-enoyl-CoA reductase
MPTKNIVIKAAEIYGQTCFIEGVYEDDAFSNEERQAAIDDAKDALEQFKQVLNQFEQTIKQEISDENQRLNSEVREIQAITR